MARRLARSLWCASACWCAALAYAAASPPPRLEQADLARPERVAAWLKANATSADTKTAQMFFQHGEKAAKRGDWGAAAKAFGEGAIHHPTPRHMEAYAAARLKMLGDLRRRDKNLVQNKAQDLGEALALYRSAVSADDALRALAATDKAALNGKVQCLEASHKAGKAVEGCEPARRYFSP